MKIRAGTRDDVPTLMRIEREAATRFIAVGLPGAFDLPCLPAEAFVNVLVAEDDVIVGFALVSFHGEDLHLDELDVIRTPTRSRNWTLKKLAKKEELDV